MYSIEQQRKKHEYYLCNKESILRKRNKYYIGNRDKIIQREKTRYQMNSEHFKQYQKNYHKEHPQYRPQYASKWQRLNKGKVTAVSAAYRARKLRATPKWLTKEQSEFIKQFYVNCPEGYHVDHIHPLKGDGFSGLHVPWNLQYLPAKENIAKGNRIPL